MAKGTVHARHFPDWEEKNTLTALDIVTMTSDDTISMAAKKCQNIQRNLLHEYIFSSYDISDTLVQENKEACLIKSSAIKVIYIQGVPDREDSFGFQVCIGCLACALMLALQVSMCHGCQPRLTMRNQAGDCLAPPIFCQGPPPITAAWYLGSRTCSLMLFAKMRSDS